MTASLCDLRTSTTYAGQIRLIWCVCVGERMILRYWINLQTITVIQKSRVQLFDFQNSPDTVDAQTELTSSRSHLVQPLGPCRVAVRHRYHVSQKLAAYCEHHISLVY